MEARDIPVVILCGGAGTRIREASESLPKPMIDVGGRPIVWHIMKSYHHYGHRKFVLLLGYKAWTIKDYFLRYREFTSDFTVRHSAAGETVEFHNNTGGEDWEVTLADTGVDTLTAARLSQARKHIDADTFMVTYGDGLADIDISGLLAHHQKSGLIGTVTAVHPTSRFGELEVDGNIVTGFAEKPDLTTGLVNGGFFVFEQSFLDYVTDDDDMLEKSALQKLTADRGLAIWQHTGFWRGMDTYREWVELNELWDSGAAPWRVWE